MRITAIKFNKQLAQMKDGDVGLVPADESVYVEKATLFRFNGVLKGIPNDIRLRFELTSSALRKGLCLLGAYVDEDGSVVSAVTSISGLGVIVDASEPLIKIIAEEKHVLCQVTSGNIVGGVLMLDPMKDMTLPKPKAKKRKK